MKILTFIAIGIMGLIASVARGQITGTVNYAVSGTGAGSSSAGPIDDSMFGYDSYLTDYCLDAAYAESVILASPQ
jgi:hypothetical protein